MASYDQKSLEALARSAGLSGTDAQVAAAVALAESGGNPAAISSTGDYGLWRINARSWPQFSTSKLLEPAYNARAMATVLRSSRGWNNWTTYRTGAYKTFLPSSGGGGVHIPGTDLNVPNPLNTAGDIAGSVADQLNPLNNVGDWVGQLSANLGKVLLGLLLSGVGLAVAWYGITRLAVDSPQGQQVTQAVGTIGAVAAIV